jgi:hypothetical protein
MFRIRREPTGDQRALAQLEPLENRTLLSYAAPVASAPGTAASPGPVIDGLTPTFKWSAVDGVDGYEIHIYDKTKASLYSADVTGANTTTYSVTLRPGDQYVWNVRDVVNNATVANTESNYLNFQTTSTTKPPALPAPVAQSPGTADSPGPVLDSSTVTFMWSGVDGVTGYHINVWDKTKSIPVVSADVDANTTSYTATLTPGHQYVWNVRDVVNGTTGAVSNYLNFQTPGATPTLAAPVAQSPGSADSPGPVVASPTVTFTWSAVSNATGYQINVYDKTKKTTVVSATVGADATSYTATLAPGDQFVWNVRGLNGTVSGPVSNYLNFQTPAVSTVPALPAPTVLGPGSPTAPGPVLATMTPTFSWNPAPDGTVFTAYQINLYDLTRQRGQTWTAAPSATSFTLPTGYLIADHKYVWNLRLRNGDQTGRPSTYFYFQAPPAATPVLPPAPKIIGPGAVPAPGPQLPSGPVTLQWNAVTGFTGLTGYQVNLYNTTIHRGFSFKVGASATQFTLTADMLIPGDDYVWNVRALAGDRSGPPSAYLFFVA